MANELTLDVRGLEPPEPLERVLEAISTMERGQQLRLLIEREPHPLYRILEANRYAYQTIPKPDGLYEIVISHKQ